MNYYCPTVNFPSPSTNLTLFSLHFQNPLIPFHPKHKPLVPLFKAVKLFNKRSLLSKRALKIKCTAYSGSEGERDGWKRWIPEIDFGADRVLKSIATATSSPICQFIPSPSTFLHSVDPRIKLDQLGRVTLLSGILFIMLALGADGVPPMVSPRTPPPSLIGLPSIPSSLQGYRYVIMKLGPLQFTRKGLSVASTSACLTFTIFQSASVCLTTTTPEQLASALRWFMLPLKHIGVPVAEIILTLLLSLRFINLVFDEVRNVALGIISRRINWEQLTIMEKIDVFVTYIRRIFGNIFSHAEQITQAMIVRGFRGDSNTHKIYFPNSAIRAPDIISLLALLALTSAALLSERLVF
ncbi:hypothetical protein Ancab_030462 [Ancistrocladus abbreviatus]